MSGINHVGFIMDGNGRWAQSRNKPRLFGHTKGALAMEKIVEVAFSRNVEVLTFYAFSTENWSRPKEEVDGIIDLLFKMLKKNRALLVKNQIRLLVSGDFTCLDQKRQQVINNVIDKTKNFKKTINILFNYGGKADILHAVNSLITKGIQNPTAEQFESELYTSDLPKVDLIIRTSGEQRLSNFMLWQSAYAEIYFTNTLWPDFDRAEYLKAEEWFLSRHRRFGNI